MVMNRRSTTSSCRWFPCMSQRRAHSCTQRPVHNRTLHGRTSARNIETHGLLSPNEYLFELSYSCSRQLQQYTRTPRLLPCSGEKGCRVALVMVRKLYLDVHCSRRLKSDIMLAFPKFFQLISFNSFSLINIELNQNYLIVQVIIN